MASLSSAGPLSSQPHIGNLSIGLDNKIHKTLPCIPFSAAISGYLKFLAMYSRTNRTTPSESRHILNTINICSSSTLLFLKGNYSHCDIFIVLRVKEAKESSISTSSSTMLITSMVWIICGGGGGALSPLVPLWVSSPLQSLHPELELISFYASELVHSNAINTAQG